MRANIKTVQTSLELIKQRLLEVGLLEDWNQSIVERTHDQGIRRVTWATNGVRPGLVDTSLSNIAEYLMFLDGRHFQFRLTDGSLLQFSYDIKHSSSNVEQSRLVWYPCPVAFQPEELTDFSLQEIILSSPTPLLNLQAPIRIDYSPRQAADNHSTTHLHLGREEFRLPVQRPMEPTRFIRLIVRTAYPKIWEATDIFREVEDWTCNDALNEDDKVCGSLGWHLAIQGVRVV